VPDARNPWIIGRSGFNTALLSVGHHRAYFELAERLPILAHARTSVDGPVSIFEPNGERKRKAEEDRKGEQRRGDCDVEPPLALKSD
jgi:hypothetical protein